MTSTMINEQDPSTLRGKQEEESMDYESDPSTFRGKQEHGNTETVDFVSDKKPIM